MQIHIRDTAMALGELGHCVTIIGPKVGPGRSCEHAAANVKVLKVGSAHGVRLSGTRFEVSVALGYQHRRLQAAMRRGAFDVVHYHSVWTPLLPFQAFACSPGAKVATFHDTPPESFRGALSRMILGAASRMLLPHIDEIIAVSEAPRAHLRPAVDRRIWLRAPCTDLRRFEQAPPRKIPSDEPVTILFVGRLEPRKGVMLLLKAYRRLCADGLPVRLVIAGSGSEEPALRGFAARHRLPRIVFSGRFADAEAPGLYASSDIVCAPSPYGESFGIVIAEAMASGRPVVAAANRGYRTLLRGAGAELLTPPGDADGLYLRLKQLVLDPPLRARFGEWGRAEARRYDCRNAAPGLVDIYRHAMAAPRRAHRNQRIGAEGRTAEAFSESG